MVEVHSCLLFSCSSAFSSSSPSSSPSFPYGVSKSGIVRSGFLSRFLCRKGVSCSFVRGKRGAQQTLAR